MPAPAIPHTDPDPHIEIEDEGDAEYWAHRLGVSREELADAVRAAGDRAADVAAYLSAKSAPGPTS